MEYKKADLTKEIQDMFEDMGIEATSVNIEKYQKHFNIQIDKIVNLIIEHIKDEFMEE